MMRASNLFFHCSYSSSDMGSLRTRLPCSSVVYMASKKRRAGASGSSGERGFVSMMGNMGRIFEEVKG